MQQTQKTNRRVLLLAYAPVLLWLCVIFFLSSSSGSSSSTSPIIGRLVTFFFPLAEEATLQFVNAAIRKAAHVTEYAILAALASRAFMTSTVSALRGYWALWAVLLAAIIGSIDEYNQSFNILRTSDPRDTLLDISGGMLAVVLIRSFVKRRKRIDNSTL